MSTGVVVDGYEIRNWHTVSILELARARREQNQPVAVPVNREMSKKKMNRRSKNMRQMKISYNQVCELHKRYMAGEGLPEIVGDYGITFTTAVKYFERQGFTYPRPKAGATVEEPNCNTTVLHPGHAAAAVALRKCGFSEDEIAEAIAKSQPAATPPTDETQMDDPESIVAAASEPSPVVEDVQALARKRARDLHANVGDSRVIAVQELPSPMLARKQYHAPRILESGSMMDVMNPHAAAKLVENLVAELNALPGMQAYFEWRAEGRTGQPLGR